MSLNTEQIQQLQAKVWNGSIPLQISLSPVDCRTYDDSLIYLTQVPRLSYLPLLLPRLHGFFSPFLIDPDVPAHVGWFSFEDIPLKWQHPIGLLYDVFAGSETANAYGSDVGTVKHAGSVREEPGLHLPWKLVLHFSERPNQQLIPLDAEWKHAHDAFINSVKEADFLRNGTAKVIMSLSKDDSDRLWDSVKQHKLALFDAVYQKFLHPAVGLPLRHIPIKIFLPTACAPAPDQDTSEEVRGAVRVVQGLIPPMATAREPQTIGTALHTLLPTLFPSRRAYIHAQAVLHGAIVPMGARMQDLMRAACYADGFLHISVAMVG